VPAASHPTIAAALARTAGVRADDVVWDPFCGSGGELVERSLLGPCRRLIGSDVDPRALEAARANLDAANVRAELIAGDALTLSPTGVTLILTNPPMGRRVARSGGATAALVDGLVATAARTLVRDGRMVWLSPLPERTVAKARTVGLKVFDVARVDLGGFDAMLQVLRR
jgi:tRNA G10  N-methylase Trm11